MKTIEQVSIWVNGVSKEAKVFNCYAINVTLGSSAIFTYNLFTELVDGSLGEMIASGNLNMTGQAYADWEVDSYAWDWAAAQLNLTITGEYIPPVSTTTTTTSTTEAPVTTTSSTTTKKA